MHPQRRAEWISFFAGRCAQAIRRTYRHIKQKWRQERQRNDRGMSNHAFQRSEPKSGMPKGLPKEGPSGSSHKEAYIRCNETNRVTEHPRSEAHFRPHHERDTWDRWDRSCLKGKTHCSTFACGYRVDPQRLTRKKGAWTWKAHSRFTLGDLSMTGDIERRVSYLDELLNGESKGAAIYTLNAIVNKALRGRPDLLQSAIASTAGTLTKHLINSGPYRRQGDGCWLSRRFVDA